MRNLQVKADDTTLMNTPPAHPYPGPLPPANVPNPPYAIVLQVTDPPAQAPNAPQPPIPILPESQAQRPLAATFNVRTTTTDRFLGTRFEGQSLGRQKMSLYRGMTANDWNTTRVLDDETNDDFLMLVTLLRNIWLSCYHHQQQLVLGQLCNVYALPRARMRVWGRVIPVLLSAFQVQFYQENKAPQFSLYADFATSSRPHIDELNSAVNAALAVQIPYIPLQYL